MNASRPELVEVFRTLRVLNLSVWRRMSPQDLHRTGLHNERGSASLAVTLRLLAGHDVSHLHQISRCIQAIEGTMPIFDEEFLKTLENLLRQPQSPKRIAVRQNGRVIFLMPDVIDWIEAADNYACLHCGGETHVLRETMHELEARLDPAHFVRVHRSAIVNIDRIKELQPWFRGGYRVILRDGTELTLTKNHRAKLNSRLLLGSFAR